jgi:uncharacterized repeat protein (TIGR04042 family)
MPEIHFHICWPDGTSEICYSPSVVVREYFSEGADYALEDFLDRSRIALAVASERVRAKHGRPCRRAIAQLAKIESTGARFAALAGARVTITALEQ